MNRLILKTLAVLSIAAFLSPSGAEAMDSYLLYDQIFGMNVWVPTQPVNGVVAPPPNGNFTTTGGWQPSNWYNIGGLTDKTGEIVNTNIGTSELHLRSTAIVQPGQYGAIELNPITYYLSPGINTPLIPTYLVSAGSRYTAGSNPNNSSASYFRERIEAYAADIPAGVNTTASNIYYPNSATFMHNNGTNSTGELIIEGAWATYNLKDGNLRVGDTLSQFGYGDMQINYGGTFNQTGGTNTVDKILYMGRFGDYYNDLNSASTYNLIGGNLIAHDEQFFGGAFNQSGGTNTVNVFWVGNTYNMSGGNLSAVIEETYGTFNQFDGTHTAGGIHLAPNTGQSGTFNLIGGSLSAGYEYIGYGYYDPYSASTTATGTFNQTGGAHTVGSLYLGQNSQGNGTYNLQGGSLSAANEYIGYSGTGTFNQSGGSNTVDYLAIAFNPGSTGTYNLSGGTLTANTIEGGINLGGAGVINTVELNIDGQTNARVFTQTGGTNTVTSILGIGNGAYDLSGGTLSAQNEAVGYSSVPGAFTQTGGAHTVNNNLLIGGYDLSLLGLGAGGGSGVGRYDLSGGTLSVNNNEYVGYSGAGTFNQTGGTHTVSGTLTVSANPGTAGTYNLSGGTLTAGGVVNNDTFNYSGGNLNANVANNGNFNLSGGGTRTVNGNFTNNTGGTVKTTGTTANFTGVFTNNGAYISDPSSNYFASLVIGADGYLIGGVGDSFFISGDFLNYSASSLWDTRNATLEFTGIGLHNYYIAGWDTGNYGWGSIRIGDGGRLNLLSSMYIDNLILGANSQINLNGFNLYYHSLTENGSIIANDQSQWLLASLYFNSGSGQSSGSSSSPVPEPSTLLLFGSGVIGLVGMRRLRSRKEKN